MNRLIFKSKDEPVEIHVIGEPESLNHAINMHENKSMFLGVELNDSENWELHKIRPAIFEHKYNDGSEIRLGDEVEIQITKSVKRRGKIDFQQSAYGIDSFESGVHRFTPLCCFTDSVVFKKLNVHQGV